MNRLQSAASALLPLVTLSIVCPLSAEDAGTSFTITSPPSELELHPFYKKYTSANGYPEKENILIHEFAHNIHLRGVVRIDPTFNQRLKAQYQRAMAAGLWHGKYASENPNEYFAEGVQSWFNNNRPPDHDHNHVDTRVELEEYDPGLAAICREVFGDKTELAYTKPVTRLHGHLAGYDPSKAPSFVWPERLNKVKQEIREKAKQRGKRSSNKAKDTAD